jgi:hypothetical protein
MKKVMLGVVMGFALAATIGFADQATERGMGGMMGQQKSGEQSSMQGMMNKMMQMVDRCNQMMEPYDAQTQLAQ